MQKFIEITAKANDYSVHRVEFGSFLKQHIVKLSYEINENHVILKFLTSWTTTDKLLAISVAAVFCKNV